MKTFNQTELADLARLAHYLTVTAVESRMTYPALVVEALGRVRHGESSLAACNWVWFHCATQEQRAEVDKWIVETGHALGFQPGTAEHRFRHLVMEGMGTTTNGSDQEVR